jgi:hypothetical protein
MVSLEFSIPIAVEKICGGNRLRLANARGKFVFEVFHQRTFAAPGLSLNKQEA